VKASRKTSRKVALTTTFLLLAAGGTAACDSSRDEDETFYCADADGTVVDEDYCDDDGRGGGGGFFIWHSSGYRTGYPVGAKLPSGGSRFAYNDKAARETYRLPPSGKVGNGTVKTSVVGKGGSNSGSSGG
jgi:hypothetical protein